MASSSSSSSPSKPSGRSRVAVIGCGGAGMCFLHALVTRRKNLLSSSSSSPNHGSDADAATAAAADTNLPEVVCFERASQPGGIWRHVPDSERGMAHNQAVHRTGVWNNISKEMFEFSDYTYQQHFGVEGVPSYLPQHYLMDYFLARFQQVDPQLLDGSLNIGDASQLMMRAGVDGTTTVIPCRRLHEIRYETVVTSVSFDASTNKFLVRTAPLDPQASKRHVYVPTFTESFDFCIWAAGCRGKPKIPKSVLQVLRNGGLSQPTTLLQQQQQQQDDKKKRRSASASTNGGTERTNGGTAHHDEAKDESSGSSPHRSSLSTSPPSIRRKRSMTPFSGKIFHSTHVAEPDFGNKVHGKRVVIIGDSDSAEDVALTLATRMDAEHVTILSRSGFGECIYMGTWPGTEADPQTDEVIPGSSRVSVNIALPFAVFPDGRSIRCNKTIYDARQEIYMVDETAEPIIVPDVDVVIFCTGFVPNTDFLSPDLCVNFDSFYWQAPPNFRMRENPFTPDIGHVTPTAELAPSGNLVPGIFRCLWMKNTKMLYLMEANSDYELLALEAQAWLVLAYITGDAPIPTRREMEAGYEEQLMQEMNVAYLRWSMDRNYFEALDELGSSHWSDDYDDARSQQVNEELFAYYVGLIARDFHASNIYPGVNLGTDADHLTQAGKQLVQLGATNLYSRHLCGEIAEECPWRTFRDFVEDGSSDGEKQYSINNGTTTALASAYSGQLATPLPKRWIDLTAEDEENLIPRKKDKA